LIAFRNRPRSEPQVADRFRSARFPGTLRKRDRDSLLQRFDAIRDFPAQHMDYRVRDDDGRDLDGHIAGRFAIHFWDDFADRHVKIMGVTWADVVA
jgi:hypothetical protein